jgi:hypothetical protein
VDLDPERFHALAQLLADYRDLDIDRLRGLIESPTGRRRRLEKNEARKLAGLTQRRGPARKPKEGGA